MSDERKRSVDDESEGTKKRKVYDELSDSGPLTQEDVKFFRKQAIWRQMKFYKDRYSMLERDVNSYKARARQSDELVAVMDAWYGQILELFSVGEACEADHLLLCDDEQASEALQKRRQQLVALLSPVLDKGAHQLDDKQLLAKVSRLNSELGDLRQENGTLLRAKQELESRIDEVTNKFLKQHEREASSTLERVHSMKKEEVKPEIKTESPAPGDISDKEVKGLREELLDFKRVNQEFEQKFAQYLQEKDQLIQELAAAKQDTSQSSSHELELEALRQDTKTTKEELQEVRGANDKLKALVSELESKQNNLISLINDEVVAENTSLKDQLTKVEADLVRIRNMRDDLLTKQQILEKSQPNEELVKLNENLLKKISLDEKSLEGNELAKELESLYNQLANELHGKLLSKVDQDNLIKKYQIEKTKADQKYFQIMRLKDALTNENKILKLQNAKGQELVDKAAELEKTYIQKIEKTTKLTTELQDANNSLKNDRNNLNKKIQVQSFEKTKLTNELNELKQQISKVLSRENSAKDQIKQKELEIIKLESRITRYERLNTNPNGSVNINSEELDGFRSMVKCSVCSKNWKNTVLTVCGHAFCNECAKERLNARLRRCPTCNKGFSANDLLSIHL